MNIEVDRKRISTELLDQLQQTVEQRHNTVEVRMTNMNRRVLKNLYDALEVSPFQKQGLQIGWRYFLADTTIAERINNNLRLYRIQDTQQVPVRTQVKKVAGVYTDLPTVVINISEQCEIEAANLQIVPAVRKQFVCKYSYFNDRGYEYIVSVSTPDNKGHKRLTDVEHDLLGQGQCEFSIRVCRENYNHSTFYHAVNALNLFVQSFNTSLELKLSLLLQQPTLEDRDNRVGDTEGTGLEVSGAPVGESGAPVGESGAPVGEFGTPVGGKFGTPVGGKFGTPVGEFGTPVGEFGAPVGEFGAPVGDSRGVEGGRRGSGDEGGVDAFNSLGPHHPQLLACP